MNTNFTDGTTVVVAAWLNDVNDTVYDILGDGTNPPTDKAALLANLGGATLTDVTDSIDAAIGVTTQAYSANLDEFATVNPTAAGLALLDDVDAAAQRTTLGLGTAATKDTGTSAGNVVVLDGSAKLPAVDGSQLTNLPSTAFPSQTGNANKVLKTDGTNVAWDSPVTSGTAINTTSGTAHDFTGIPSWVKKITLSLRDVSTVGAGATVFQLGTAGGIVVAGYTSVGSYASSSGYASAFISSGGFVTFGDSAADNVRQGSITFSKVSGNVWVASGVLANSGGAPVFTLPIAGSVDLGAVLTTVRVTNTAGDTFDSGIINILYE